MRASMLPIFGRVAVASVIGILAHVTPSAASTIIYTFEAPVFADGDSTPILDRTANVGDPTFETDFTSSPAATGLITANFQPNPLISGLALLKLLDASSNTLTLLFSAPVFSLEVDFALNAGSVSRLELTTPVGAMSQAGANVGGSAPGGTLVFTSPLGFTSAQLAGFGAGTTRVEFLLDHLTLETSSPIPEPTSVLLLGTGLVAAGMRRYRRRS
jgi:hypothetical protein